MESIHNLSLFLFHDTMCNALSGNEALKTATHNTGFPTGLPPALKSCHRIGCGADSASITANTVARI